MLHRPDLRFPSERRAAARPSGPRSFLVAGALWTEPARDDPRPPRPVAAPREPKREEPAKG